MVKLRCQDCGEVYEGKRSDVDDLECDCGGGYAIMGSEDDEYEAETCAHCNKEVVGEDEFHECDECGDSVCDDCTVMDLENVTICKQCVDKAYPKRIVEKPVEVYLTKDGTPVDNKFNPAEKTKFD